MKFKLTLQLKFTTSPGGWWVVVVVGGGFYEINAKPALTKVGVKVLAELGNIGIFFI